MLSGLGYQSVTGSTPAATPASWPLPALDRLVVAYLALPLMIFVASWLQLVVALPLLVCITYALRELIAPAPVGAPHLPVTRLHLGVAVAVGIAWTYLGGTAHFVFANADWYVRDAVLHDLVVSPWPVGYGAFEGGESLLRAPLAYYLPAALTGKLLGLAAAHLALAAWTAAGACLFLLQVLSLTRSRLRDSIFVCTVVVLFSGMDIVGCLLNLGPRFLMNWHLGNHIEWWAGKYQYSSMTTQLFWVPNHALGGWLTIGLLCRDRRPSPLHSLLPIVVVAAMLWSPLAALGVVPFVLCKVLSGMVRDRSLLLLHPRVWAPALAVGLVVAAYLVLDAGAIPKGFIVGGQHRDVVADIAQQAQFFLLEAGLIGFAILALRRSRVVALALVILAILPVVHFGPGNDLVMRGSIPSLAVLAIASCLVLLGSGGEPRARLKKAVLGLLLLVGAVTPVEEIARALLLPAWPIDMRATLLDANCGSLPAHYVARLGDGMIARLLRAPHRLAAAGLGRAGCTNPAWRIMAERGLLDT
jgi:hypothetical protein